MQNLPFLYMLPLWAIYLLTVVFFTLVIEGGYRFSRNMQSKSPDKAESGVGALAGATLALLGFLLAFVSGTALNISTTRRQLVVAEANAIGTTYLRAGYLPDAIAEPARELLREYVDVRLQALDQDQLSGALTRSEEIHAELWALAETVAIENPSPVTSLYIASVNEVIDLHTERQHASLVVRVPDMIIIGLYIIGALTLGMVGLHAGYTERRNLVALTVLVIILSSIYLLIFDLERGQSGMIQVPQTPLIDLQRQLNGP